MKKITRLFTIVLASFALTSCLNDDNYAVDPANGTNNVVEFYNTSVPISNYNAKYVEYIPKTLENIPEDEFMIGVNWAGAEDVAPVDIVVDLALAPEVAAERGYNQVNTSLFTMPMQATIKKGEKFALIPVKVKANQLDGDLPNAIALKIVKSSHGVISRNVGTAIFSIPVKNPYDGVYTYRSAPTQTLEPNRTTEIELRTINASTVRMYPGLVGLYSNQVDLVVDKNTNKVTVVMTTLLPIVNTDDSYWDPATKTFHLKWYSGGGNRYFEETITFKEPRG